MRLSSYFKPICLLCVRLSFSLNVMRLSSGVFQFSSHVACCVCASVYRLVHIWGLRCGCSATIEYRDHKYASSDKNIVIAAGPLTTVLTRLWKDCVNVSACCLSHRICESLWNHWQSRCHAGFGWVRFVKRKHENACRWQIHFVHFLSN